jgi:hypothetical protein
VVAKTNLKGKEECTVLDEISAFETNELTKLSRAARSPMLQSMARFNKLLAVSVGLFLVYIVMNALSTASYIDLS